MKVFDVIQKLWSMPPESDMEVWDGTDYLPAWDLIYRPEVGTVVLLPLPKK